MAFDPDLLNGLADDFHQVAPESETDKGGDDNGQRDAREHLTKVLEVVQEGFFGFGVRFVPDFENFVEDEHEAGASIRGNGGVLKGEFR